jgi:cytoskeletal protein CcmA (bactofilin family)
MKESPDTQSSSSNTSSWSPAMGTAPGSAQQSLIGPTVVIKGELSAEEDLLIMGRVEGFIDHSQTVTIHAKGTVAAEVKAREVLVEGSVKGNVYGTQRVEIAETGQVTGNVYAPKVGVLEGANFKGSIDMDPDAAAIERRFREKSGMQDGADAGKSDKSSKTDSAASKVATAAADKITGEDNAEQNSEKGNSSNSASAESGKAQ